MVGWWWVWCSYPSVEMQSVYSTSLLTRAVKYTDQLFIFLKNSRCVLIYGQHCILCFLFMVFKVNMHCYNSNKQTFLILLCSTVSPVNNTSKLIFIIFLNGVFWYFFAVFMTFFFIFKSFKDINSAKVCEYSATNLKGLTSNLYKARILDTDFSLPSWLGL